jgi:hypothetical protein
MKFIQDFLSFSSLGILGVILVGIGIIGCVLHRRANRLAGSAGVALIGAMLLLDGSAKLHHAVVPWAFVVVFGVVLLGLILRAMLDTGPHPPEETSEPS